MTHEQELEVQNCLELDEADAIAERNAVESANEAYIRGDIDGPELDLTIREARS